MKNVAYIDYSMATISDDTKAEPSPQSGPDIEPSPQPKPEPDVKHSYPIIHFQHEFLSDVFIDKNPLPEPIGANKIRIYDGSLEQCCHCRTNRSAYLYIDWVLSTRRFMCPECLDEFNSKRAEIIHFVEKKFKEAACDAGYSEDEPGVDDDDDPLQGESKPNDNARSPLENEWFVIMQEVNGDDIYLLSYNELFGAAFNESDALEDADLSDEFEFEHESKWFKLPENFMLV